MFFLIMVMTCSCQATEYKYEKTAGDDITLKSLINIAEGCKWLFKSSTSDLECCYSNSHHQCPSKESCHTEQFKVIVNNNTQQCILEIENLLPRDSGAYIQLYNFNFTQELLVNPDPTTQIVIVSVFVTISVMVLLAIVALFIIYYLKKKRNLKKKEQNRTIELEEIENNRKEEENRKQEEEERENGMALLGVLQNGNKDSFEILCQRVNVLKARDKKGNSVLHYVGFHNWNEIKTDMILNDWKKKNMIGTSVEENEEAPLLNTSKIVQMVDKLVTKINVNEKNTIKETPLHIAAKNGYVEVLEALLNISDIDVNAADKDSNNPLHNAALKNHINVIRNLMGHPKIQIENIDNDGMTPLLRACSEGKYEAFKTLKQKASMDAKTKDGKNILHILAQRRSDQVNKGKLQILKSIFEPLETDFGEETQKKKSRLDPLLSAATYKKYDGLIPSYCGQTPLETAVVDGFLEAAKLLSEHTANLWYKYDASKTPHPIHLIFYAVRKNFKKLAMSLHRKDPDKVNMRIKNTMQTYLHLAVNEMDLNAVILLLNMNIDKEAKDSKGQTALDIAQEKMDDSNRTNIIFELNKTRTDEEKDNIKTNLDKCIADKEQKVQKRKAIEEEKMKYKEEELEELDKEIKKLVKDRNWWRKQLKELEGEGEEEK